MHLLVPEFILQNHKSRNFHGAFEAAVLRVDISGFTSLTESLMQQGKAGAGALADTITAVFTPLEEMVYQNGGFIAGFAGDAFIAVFPREDRGKAHLARLAAAGHSIQIYLAGHPIQSTAFGEFPFAARLGTSLGTVEWGILSSPNPGKNTFYFKGWPIRQAAKYDTRLLNASPATPGARKEKAPEAVPPKYFPDDCSPFFPASLTEHPRRGEFRQVATVFIGLKGNPGHAQLQTLFDHFQGELDRYGGYLCRLDFGDAGCRLLLFWGAPVGYEDDLERALDYLLAFKLGSPIPFRAGVTYGPAYAGFIGAAQREEYTCYSSRVNLAARLMSSAGWGEIRVSQLAAGRTGGQFLLEPAGSPLFKGFSTPQPVFLLKGTTEREKAFFQGQMAGREKDLRQLMDFVRPIFDRRFAGIGYVCGEAGQGKSRLVYELSRRLGGSVTWLEAQTGELVRTPFNPFIHILKNYFGQKDNDPPEVRQKAFDERLQFILQCLEKITDEDPALGTAGLITEIQRTRSILAAFVGLPQPGSLWERLDARGRHENTIYAIRTLLLAESRLHPLVLFIDDGHCLDADSRELLIVLTRNVDDYPLVILSALRYADDGSRPDFGLEGIPVFRLDLNALDTGGVQAMAQSWLEGPVAWPLQSLLEDQTGGNPFFIEQMLFDLQERKALAFTLGKWNIIPGREAEIPASINVILIARIDRLDRAVQEVVKAAAVLGREFERNILLQMLGNDLPGQKPGELIRDAERQGIWHAVLSQQRYLFKHTLLRDTAYDMQLQARLSALHRRAAEAYENRHASELALYYAEIAFHYEKAFQLGGKDLRSRARDALANAGRQAAALYNNAAAIDYFDRALEITPEADAAARFDLLLQRAASQHWLGMRQPESRDLETLESLADQLQTSSRQLEVLLLRTRYAEATSDYQGTVTSARRAVELARASHETNLEAEGHLLWGGALVNRQAYVDGREHYKQALDLARAAGDRSREAEALRCLGSLDVGRESSECLTELQAALAIYRELGNLPGEARTLHSLANLLNARFYDYDRARQYYMQCIDLQKKLGNRSEQERAISNLAYTLSMLGRYGEAYRYYEQALTIGREIGDRKSQAVTLNAMGDIAYIARKDEMALHFLEEALTISRALGDRGMEAAGLHNLGEIARLRGEYDRAERYFRRALALRTEIGLGHSPADDLCGLAGVALDRGDIPQALEYIDRFLEHLSINPMLEGTHYPARDALNAYKVLKAAGGPRAVEFLTIARNEIIRRAAMITNDTLRHSYVHDIPANREIVEEYNKVFPTGNKQAVT